MFNNRIEPSGALNPPLFVRVCSEGWTKVTSHWCVMSPVRFLLTLFASAAIEGSGIGGMKLPVGMTRRALSYDDNLEAPMSTPPHDISINNLWRRPVIPERKFTRLAEVRPRLRGRTSVTQRAAVMLFSVCQEDEGGAVAQPAAPDSAHSRSSGVVKAKASSIIMNSLITSTLPLMTTLMCWI